MADAAVPAVTVVLPAAVRAAVVDHAREGAPEEVVGVLAGRRGDDVSTVERALRARNAADAPLELRDDLAGPPLPAERPPDAADVRQHVAQTVRVGRHQLTVQPQFGDGRLDDHRVDGAHLADTLRDDDVGVDGGQRLAVDPVDAALGFGVLHLCVDVGASGGGVDPRLDDGRTVGRLWRVVALVGGRDRLDAQRVDDLRRRRQQRDDARGVAWHPCPTQGREPVQSVGAAGGSVSSNGSSVFRR